MEGTFTFYANVPDKAFTVGPGQTFRCTVTELSRAEDLKDDPELKAWDEWVSEMRAVRKADIATGLRESGLSAPIPGLVDLVRSGTFTDCPPYGKCWAPTETIGVRSLTQAADLTPASNPATVSSQGPSSLPQPQNANASFETVMEDWGISTREEGPCGYGPTLQIHTYMYKTLKITPQNPKGEVVSRRWRTECIRNGSPGAPEQRSSWADFPWATCHAGSWITGNPADGFNCMQGDRVKSGKCLPPPKKWVVGQKSSQGSLLQVRVGKSVGFIPKHPLDTVGKPPLNAKEGVVVLKEKRGHDVAQVKPLPAHLQIEKSYAGALQTKWIKNTQKVERPVIKGSLLRNGTEMPRGGNVAGNQKDRADIHYDYKSKNFVAPYIDNGGRRMGDRPDFLTRSSTSLGSNGGAQRARNDNGSDSHDNTRGPGSPHGSSPSTPQVNSRNTGVGTTPAPGSTGGSNTHSGSSSGGGTSGTPRSSSGGDSGGSSRATSGGSGTESRGGSQSSAPSAPAPSSAKPH